MKYTIKPTSQFKRDLKLAKKRGLSREALETVIAALANGEQLDPKYFDHELSGNWEGYRECHIQPDLLLVYLVEDDILTLTLTDTGTHSDIFDE